MSHDWNYHEDDPTHGPHHWAHQYPDVGQAQSPIDIQIDYSDLQRHQDQVCCSCDRLPLHKGLQGLTIGHSNSGQPGGWSKESDGDPKRNEGGGSTGGQCNSEDDGCLANARLAEGRNGLSAAEGEHLAREQSKCERLNEKKDSIRESEGERQRTRYCATNKKLFLGYPRYLDSIRLSNTGHAWQVDMPQELGQHTRKYDSANLYGLIWSPLFSFLFALFCSPSPSVAPLLPVGLMLAHETNIEAA